jgi:hypothetical protein
VQLVTSTVKGALTDAQQFIHDTNHTITSSLLASARPDPMTAEELMNEPRPIPQMPHWIQIQHFLLSRFAFGFMCGFPAGEGVTRRQQSRSFISFQASLIIAEVVLWF